MRILKWVVAAVLVLYTLWSAMPAYFTTMFKLRPGYQMTGMGKYVPLMQSTSAIQLVVWWLGLFLFLWAALRVARNERALLIYVAGFVLDVGGWLMMKLGPVYNQVFSPGEQMVDYGALVLLVVIGLAIWRLDNRPVAVAAPA